MAAAVKFWWCFARFCGGNWLKAAQSAKSSSIGLVMSILRVLAALARGRGGDEPRLQGCARNRVLAPGCLERGRRDEMRGEAMMCSFAPGAELGQDARDAQGSAGCAVTDFWV